jgi:hypothetical protein
MQNAHQAFSAAGRHPCAFCLLTAAVALVLSFGPPTAVAQSAEPSLLPDGGGAAGYSLPSPIGDLHYTPGRGLRVGDTGLALGGYADAFLSRNEGGPADLGTDDVSVFVIWDPVARFHFFSELEGEDLVHVDDHGHGGTNESTFVAERLYADVTASDRVALRVGKFLTPVGRWNVIHAQPLVWTTSRPLTTMLPFDAHTTGAMLFGSLLPDDTGVTYSVYGQFVNSLDPQADQPYTADRSAGLRLACSPLDEWSVGASYLASHTQGDWDHLLGVDTLWRRGALELMGEGVVEDGAGHLGWQWGFYLQPVLRVLPRTYLVGRYEHFDQRAPAPQVNLIVTGLAFKPVPQVVLKGEYLFADHVAEDSPPGFKASMAILF